MNSYGSTSPEIILRSSYKGFLLPLLFFNAFTLILLTLQTYSGRRIPSSRNSQMYANITVLDDLDSKCQGFFLWNLANGSHFEVIEAIIDTRTILRRKFRKRNLR